MLTLEDRLETDKISHFKYKPKTILYVATQRKECLMLTFFFLILSKMHNFFDSVYPSTSVEVSLSPRELCTYIKELYKYKPVAETS